MKYIFVAGAPGSKWSSVVKNIYQSPNIDRSDDRPDWTYYHDAAGEMQLMHMGAYFDPGMECDLPADLSTLTKEELEARFDQPFSKDSTGTRIIKSHIFSNNIEVLRRLWPEVPIVLVYRSDDSCLGWWVKCGHFNITYPKYDLYYKNLRNMARIIAEQNRGIMAAWEYSGQLPKDNLDLCKVLGIQRPLINTVQTYGQQDISVKVI